MSAAASLCIEVGAQAREREDAAFQHDVQGPPPVECAVGVTHPCIAPGRVGEEIVQALVNTHEERQAGCQITVYPAGVALLPARISSRRDTPKDLPRLGIRQLPPVEQPDHRTSHGRSLFHRDLRDFRISEGWISEGTRNFGKHGICSFWLNIPLFMPFGSVTWRREVQSLALPAKALQQAQTCWLLQCSTNPCR